MKILCAKKIFSHNINKNYHFYNVNVLKAGRDRSEMSRKFRNFFAETFFPQNSRQIPAIFHRANKEFNVGRASAEKNHPATTKKKFVKQHCFLAIAAFDTLSYNREFPAPTIHARRFIILFSQYFPGNFRGRTAPAGRANEINDPEAYRAGGGKKPRFE